VAGAPDGVGIAAGSMLAEESPAVSALTGAAEAVSGPDTSDADAAVATDADAAVAADAVAAGA
jgi:hypothetical protein